jgi:hypothetical protein
MLRVVADQAPDAVTRRCEFRRGTLHTAQLMPHNDRPEEKDKNPRRLSGAALLDTK